MGQICQPNGLDPSRYPHCSSGHQWAVEVLTDRPVGELTALAARRYVGDLEKSQGPDGYWTLNLDRAELVCEFVSQLRNVKGPVAGQPIALMPWQRFLILNLFGWIDSLGFRRYRTGCVYVPRGNGKSTLLAAIAIYMLCADGEAGAEIYSAATSAQQARIVFGTASKMVSMDPQLKAAFRLDVQKVGIFEDGLGGEFKPLASRSNTLEGLATHLAVLDELAAHPTPEVYEVLQTSLGKRKQPMLLAISTCQLNDTGIGRQEWNYSQKILESEIEDERYFALIFHADETDDPWLPATWEKANPSWGESVQVDAFESIAKKAQQDRSQEASFKTRHLNMWATDLASLFDMGAWDSLADPSLLRYGTELESAGWDGRTCYMGLDLARVRDFTAISYIFPPEEEGEKATVFVRTYVPQRKFLQMVREYPVLKTWRSEGWLRVQPGPVISYAEIENQIKNDIARFDVDSLAADPWNAGQLIERLESDGVPTAEVRQTFSQMSEPTKELNKMVLAGELRHDNNPVLRFCMANCLADENPAGEIRPGKLDEDRKIDSAVALITAMRRYLSHNGDVGELLYTG